MEPIVIALPCIPIFVNHEPLFLEIPYETRTTCPASRSLYKRKTATKRRCLSFLVIGTPAYQLEWISFCVCRTIKQNIIREFHHHMQVAGRFDLFA